MNYINTTMFLIFKMLKNKYILIGIVTVFFNFFVLSNIDSREIPGSAYDFNFVDMREANTLIDWDNVPIVDLNHYSDNK